MKHRVKAETFFDALTVFPSYFRCCWKAPFEHRKDVVLQVVFSLLRCEVFAPFAATSAASAVCFSMFLNDVFSEDISQA